MLIVLAGFTGFSLLAQEVPSKVTKAFQSKFGKAGNVTWDMEDGTEWEAEFTMDKKTMSACFDTSGKWLETERKISVSALPDAVRESLKAHYGDYEIEAVEQIETPDSAGYEIRIEKNERTMEVWAAPSGEITVKNESADED